MSPLEFQLYWWRMWLAAMTYYVPRTRIECEVIQMKDYVAARRSVEHAP